MSKVQVDTIVDKDDISAPTLSKGAIVTGVCTATTFVGAVTGDVTGNATGLTGSPNITVTDVNATGVTTTGIATVTTSVVVGSAVTANADGVITAGVGTFGSVVSSGAISGTTGTFTGQLSVADKVQFTVASPQLEFNNGGPRLWSPSANTLTIHTGGGFDSASNERLRVTSGGLVGVGTTIPDDQLTVRGSNGSGLRVGDGTANVLLGTGAGPVGRLYTISNHGLIFGTNDSERLRIGTSGEIGIGGANYGTSGQVLTSGGSGSAVSWADAGGGISEIDAWTISGSWPYIASTWTNARLGNNANDGGTGILERNAENNMPVGTGMTHTDGLFTFPSAGTWQIDCMLHLERYSTSNVTGLRVGLCGDVDGSGRQFTTTEQDVNSYITHTTINLTGIMKFTNTGTSNFYVKLNGSGNVYIKALSATQNLIFKKLA